MLDFLELVTEDLDCIKKPTEKLTENDWKYIKVDPIQFYGDNLKVDISNYSTIMNDSIFIPNPRIRQRSDPIYNITLHHSDNRIILDFHSIYIYNDLETRFIVGTNTIGKPQIFISNVEIIPNSLSVYFNGLRMADGFDYNIISEPINPNNLSINFL